MRFARQSGSSSDIPASKAVSGRRYKCPVCGEQVFVRGGKVYRRHFAHVSNRADPDCENYYPSGKIVGPIGEIAGSGGVHGDARQLSLPYIGIMLEAVTARVPAGDRRWKFGLVLPVAPSGYGRLKIETGFGTFKDIRLSELLLNEGFVTVDVDRPFGVKWVSDEVDHDYKQAVESGPDDFAIVDRYVFGGAGKIRKQMGMLSWGGSYLFVWRSLPTELLPELEVARLADNGCWSAGLVTLPTETSEQVERWIVEQFGVSISTTTRNWGLIYPPPVERDVDGAIVVGTSTSLIAGFVDDDDESRSDNEVVARIDAQSVATNCDATRTAVSFVIAPEYLNYPLNISWGGRRLETVVQDRRQHADLSISLTYRNQKGLAKAALHHVSAQNAFSEIRSADADLVAITIPAHCGGALQVRMTGLIWENALIVDAEENERTLNAATVSQIQALVRDRSSDVILDFGTLGRVALYATYLPKVAPGLRAELRERIEWALRLHPRPGVAISSDLSDEKLLELLRSEPFSGAARRNFILHGLGFPEGGLL